MIAQIKKYLYPNGFYILFMVFFLYAMIYILLKDVMNAEVYNFHIRQLAYVGVFGYLFYFFSKKVLKKNFSYMKGYQILIFIVCSFFLAYGVQFTVKHRIEKNIYDTKEFINPLYTKYKMIEKKYDIDLSFTKITKEQRGPVNYKINTIYTEKPKSIDILIFGDSSVAWGVIPEVIEQITHKKVAIFAYESNCMTEKTAQLFNKISTYYLKDDGFLVLSFDNSFYSKNPKSVLTSKKAYKEMMSWNDKRFAAFAQSKENKDINTIIHTEEIQKSTTEKNNEVEVKNIKERFSFQVYQDKYHAFSDYLSKEFHMNLNSVDFYTLYLDGYFNPTWNKKKNVNIHNNTTLYLRWDLNTITLYDNNFDHLSLYSDDLPSTPLSDSNIQSNAIAAVSIYGRNKLFMVPLFSHNKHYLLSRNIYNTYYKKLGFKLLDLGVLHPKTEGYPMQWGSHMGNEGGVMKSILIGRSLKPCFE